jgi:hypothetical protein
MSDTERYAGTALFTGAGAGIIAGGLQSASGILAASTYGGGMVTAGVILSGTVATGGFAVGGVCLYFAYKVFTNTDEKRE